MPIAHTATTTMMARITQPPMSMSLPSHGYYSLGFGASGLRAAKRNGQRDPYRGERDGTGRDGARLHAERAQPRNEPAAGGVGAAHRDDVDHVLGLVLLVAREHREQHLARRIGDGEVRR